MGVVMSGMRDACGLILLFRNGSRTSNAMSERDAMKFDPQARVVEIRNKVFLDNSMEIVENPSVAILAAIAYRPCGGDFFVIPVAR